MTGENTAFKAQIYFVYVSTQDIENVVFSLVPCSSDEVPSACVCPHLRDFTQI